MKRSVKILLAAALTGFATLASAQAKIGVVNTDKLAQESPQYQAAQAAINVEFGNLAKEIQGLEAVLQARQEKLQKDAATMTDMQRGNAERELQANSTELRRKQAAFDEDLNARREEEVAKLQRTLSDEIATYAKANGYDLILVSGVGYVSTGYNITAQLIEAMKKKAGVATAAPATAPAAAKPPAAAPATKPPATPAKP